MIGMGKVERGIDLNVNEGFVFGYFFYIVFILNRFLLGVGGNILFFMFLCGGIFD